MEKRARACSSPPQTNHPFPFPQLTWTADTHDTPISLSYVIELDALLVVSGPTGALTTLAAGDGVATEVGAVDGGLAAASPSPTGDCVALITTTGRMLLIGGAGADWAPLGDADALAWCDAPVPARTMPPRQTGPVTLTPGDAFITWKGDGTELATVVRAGAGHPFVLRVHTAPSGDLAALGEGGDPLAGPVAWQPNGRHVYAAVRVVPAASEAAAAARPTTRALTPAAPDAASRAAHPGRIALIEPNGMRHGDFGVVEPGWRVVGVAWSPCSEVVAIVAERESGSDAPAIATIQLWRRCNWHWHAAGRRAAPAGVAVAWDDGAPLRLHAAWRAPGDTLTLATTDYILAPTTSPAGTAAVLDGRGVRVTPLARCALPPPLAAATIETPSPGVAVAVGGTMDGGEAVAVLTVDGGVSVAVCGAGGDDWQSVPSLAASPLPLPADWHAGGTPRALAWATPESLIAVITAAAGAGDGRDEAVEVSVRGAVLSRARLPSPSVTLVPHPGGAACGNTLIHTADGSVWEWAPGRGPVARVPLPRACPRVWSLGDGGAALGLTQSGDLHLGPTVIARAIRSVGVRWGGAGGAAVITIGGDDVLRVSPTSRLATGGLAPGPPPPPPPPDKDVPAGSWKADMRAAMRGAGLRTTRRGDPAARAVEAGSTVVAVPPSGCAVILAMPRGNLETVWPRALVLASVGASLAARDWQAAAAAVATHRLDPNLLVDYAWPSFIDCAADYVAATGDDAAVADLVRALAPGSTLAGRYSWLSAADPAASTGPPTDVDKVAIVAAALRDALAAAPGGEAAWLRPTVAAHAALADLPAALAAVRRVRQAELAATGGATPAPHPLTEKLGVGRVDDARALPPTPADAGLRALLLSTPFDSLYAAALGAYDLEVAHMVVLAAGRDPGEYLAELRTLAARPAGPLRRAAVDARLGRWERVLDALVEAGPDHADEALAVATAHGLLRRLAGALPPGSPARAAALAAYASHLTSHGRHEDAALARLTAGDVVGAIASYAEAGAWRAALGLAQARGTHDAAALADLAATLADTLASSARYADAACVAERYLHDVDRAVEWLAAGGEWHDALRVGADAGRSDLVDTTVAPAVADAAAAALDDARTDAERARKYLARYKDVQARRVAMQAAVGERDGLPDDDDDGGASAVTGITGLSAYTLASNMALTAQSSSAASIAPSTMGGRGGRKEKAAKPKARHRVRVGSSGEEAALAATLAAAAPTDHKLACVGALTEALVMLGHEDDARALQAAVSDAVAAAAAAADHVKTHPPATSVEGGEGNILPPKPAEWKWDLLRGG